MKRRECLLEHRHCVVASKHQKEHIAALQHDSVGLKSVAGALEFSTTELEASMVTLEAKLRVAKLEEERLFPAAKAARDVDALRARRLAAFKRQRESGFVARVAIDLE